MDGALVSTNPWTTAENDYIGTWLVGYDLNNTIEFGESTNFFGGTLARIAIYTAPLNATRVAAHASATSDVVYDEAVLADTPYMFYKLADPVGSSGPSDSSGNGYNGNVYGAVTYGETGPFTYYNSIQTNVLTFVTAIPAGNPQPEAGDLVMFGLLNSETAPLLITKIEPSHDLSAKITAVDYAPDIYNADGGTVPTSNSQGAAAPTRPVPQIATVNSSDSFSVRDADGSIEVRIMITLTPVSTMMPDAGSIIGIEYEFQTSSTQALNDRGAYNSSSTYNTFDAVTYEGQIWVALADGITDVAPGSDSNDWSALDAQGLNNLGAYDSSTTYNVSDMVEYGGQFWVAIADGVVGVTPGTNGDDWTIVVESSPWTAPAEVPASSLVIVTGVEAKVSYNIQLRYVFVDGSRGDWSVIIHTVAGQTTLPYDPTDLTATITHKSDVKLKWTAPSSRLPNFDGYEIVAGGVAISTATESGGTATITTASAHGYAVGDSVIISGVSVAGYNGTFVVATVPTSTTFTYAPTTSGLASAADGATVCWDSATTFVDRTLKTNYLIVDPLPGTNLYWVAARDTSRNIDAQPPFVNATVAALPNVTGLSYVITKKNDIKLTWTPIVDGASFKFEDYEIRTDTNPGSATNLIGRTKLDHFLIIDPSTQTTTVYYVYVRDKAGNYDASPASVTPNFTQQAYTSKTLLSSDVGPFTGTTAILTVDFTVPPSGGRIHVDWTMLLTNGATEQNAIGYVQDDTNSLLCAQHRTHLPSSQVHGFNASGHFNKLYTGGSVVELTLYCEPTNSKNLTVNAEDEFGVFGTVSGTFLDIQFHPSPN